MFQQMNLAEERANGMDVRNATLEQLCYQDKEEEITTALQRLQAMKPQLGLPNVLKKTKVSLTYSVLISIRRAPNTFCCQNTTAGGSAT